MTIDFDIVKNMHDLWTVGFTADLIVRQVAKFRACFNVGWEPNSL